MRSWRLTRPLDLRATLGPLSRGGYDRTVFVRSGAELWRATRTPLGPATERIGVNGETVTVEAWGEGSDWLLEHAPELLGEHDDDGGLVAHHELVTHLRRRFPGLRIGRTLAVFEALLPTVLEQKVTGREARQSYGALLRHWAEPAPGPAPPGARPLWLPPHPKVVTDTPSHVFHAHNVERKRSDTIRRAASYAHRLEEAAATAIGEGASNALSRKLLTLTGVGPWSVAEVAAAAIGDADAVSVGDYHLKNTVSWNLAGEARGTDERMIELLEPYRPHRGRVVRLIELGGRAAPAYGPRMTIQTRW